MSDITNQDTLSDVEVKINALTNASGISAQYNTVVLKKHIVNGVNTLTQEMMSAANTKYVIKYDYILGENITIPAGCILEFDGGSIANSTGNSYTLTGTITKVVNLYNYTIFSNITPTGITTFTGMFT